MRSLAQRWIFALLQYDPFAMNLACALSLGALLVACGTRSAEAPRPQAPSTTQTLATPARWDVLSNGRVFLQLTDRPGFLIDSNAPPPPPGPAPRPHPFLSGACAPGFVLECSQAGNHLRASHSTQEFLQRLQSAGFAVRPSN